jgi:two-component sensor histidine kinase
LATNAAKYGALSTPEGRLAVTWSVTPVDGEPCLELVWQESGGPFVNPPTKKGFGSQLIRNTFSGEHKKAEFSFLPAGVRCVIAVPLDRSGRVVPAESNSR